MKVLFLALFLILAGCSATNVSELVKAMAGDPATVCAQVNTIYGTMKLSRTNIQNGNVTCSGDGLTVKSEGVTSIPVAVKPVQAAN